MKVLRLIIGYVSVGLFLASGNLAAAQGSCLPVKTYAGATNPGVSCSSGVSGAVTLTACLPDKCALTGASVSYESKSSSCSGRESAVCSSSCSESATSAILTIPVGKQCASVTLSCTVPNSCGSCSSDIDNYGLKKWENYGCGGVVPPTATPTPKKGLPVAVSNLTITPTPIFSGRIACLEVAVSPALGLAPLTTRLTATVSGSVEKYRYTFGDGLTAEVRSGWVDHTYRRDGIFFPKVEVAGSDGRFVSSDKCSGVVKVGQKSALPSTGFSSTWLIGLVGLGLALRLKVAKG